MPVRRDKQGRQTFVRSGETALRGGWDSGAFADEVVDLPLPIVDQIRVAGDFESLKLSTHEALENLRNSTALALNQVANAVLGRSFTRKWTTAIRQVGNFLRGLTEDEYPGGGWEGSDSYLAAWTNSGQALTHTKYVNDVVSAMNGWTHINATPGHVIVAGAVVAGQSSLVTTFSSAISEGDIVTASSAFGAANQILLAQGNNKQATTTSTTIGDLATGTDIAEMLTSVGDLATGTDIAEMLTSGQVGVSGRVVNFNANTREVTHSDIAITNVITSNVNMTSGRVIMGGVANKIITNSSLDVDKLVHTQGGGTLDTDRVPYATGSNDLNSNANLKFDPDGTADGRFILDAMLNLGTPSELTIASGAVTITQTRHNIDTESDAATDNLDTINGGVDGDILILQSANAARDTTIRDNGVGGGNIELNLSGGSFTLTGRRDVICLMYDNNNAKWLELFRSDNT
jgi:hypothetical protein